MRRTRTTILGLALVAAIATTACPGNESETDTSPAPQSGATGGTGLGGGATGQLTGGG